GDGRRIWEKYVIPARVDLAKVAAHYGVSLLFKEYPRVANTYCFTVEREEMKQLESERARLAMGRLRVYSDIILESARFNFAVLHFGGHNLTGGVYPWDDEAHDQAIGRLLERAFERADLPEAIRHLDQSFSATTYSLRSLFKDEQRWILNRMLEPAIEETEA